MSEEQKKIPEELEKAYWRDAITRILPEADLRKIKLIYGYVCGLVS